MKILKSGLLIGVFAAIGAVPVLAGQVHKYFAAGTVWTVSMVGLMPGLDQSYLQYHDSQFKKSEDAHPSGSPTHSASTQAPTHKEYR